MSIGDKLERLRKLKEEARLGGGRQRIDAQHARGKLTARERLDILLDEGSFTELETLVVHRSTEFGDGRTALPRRRRRDRLRANRRAAGLRLLAGLHGVRRVAVGGRRREDLPRDGHGREDRLPDHRPERFRRRAHPGGRRQPGRLRGHLPAQRAQFRRRAADIGHHGALRRRRRLFAGDDGLHLHGPEDVADVHHGAGRHPGGDAGGGRRTRSWAAR